MVDVPDVDKENGSDDGLKQYEQIQLRSLDADVQARENLNREADQRHQFRIWSVVLASLFVFLFMVILFHVVMNMPDLIKKKAPPLVIVVLFAAPITAIASLIVSLLLAAFRGTKEGDEKSVADGAWESVRAAGGLS